MFQIVKKRYIFFGISLLVIIPGMLALLIWGLPLAIDFTGGSLLDVRFESGQKPVPAQIVALYASHGYEDTLVETSANNEMIIRSKNMEPATEAILVAEMEKQFGGSVTVQRFDSVGPAIGSEVTTRAAGAVGFAALGILLYITFAFRGVQHAFRFGASAIIAMMHDIAVVLGVEAILGHFLGWQVDSLFFNRLADRDWLFRA